MHRYLHTSMILYVTFLVFKLFLLAMNPMMDGYGDRSGYGSHGMPPGHGGMHNPGLRMRYPAMMGQERWPPPPHQYMPPTQHHQAMAAGPMNRFQVSNSM